MDTLRAQSYAQARYVYVYGISIRSLWKTLTLLHKLRVDHAGHSERLCTTCCGLFVTDLTLKAPDPVAAGALITNEEPGV